MSNRLASDRPLVRYRELPRQLFDRCGGMQVVRWLHRKGVTILMYHKFPAEQSFLRKQCEYFRKYHHVISLAQVSEALRNGDRLPNSAVVITVDDGHGSFYRHAYPVFAKFGFPVTVYLTTGPMDDRGWLWFDRVAYSFLASRKEEVELPTPAASQGLAAKAEGATCVAMRLETKEQRLALAEQYMEQMKLLPTQHARLFMDQLEKSLGVQVPTEAPEEWASLRWEDVRTMARDNVEFGAHSITHPILANLEQEAQIHQEVAGSKTRIENELGTPVLHFAYPNGQPRDVSTRVINAVRQAGFESSVTTVGGQVFSGDDPFLLKRMACSPELSFFEFQKHVTAFRT